MKLLLLPNIDKPHVRSCISRLTAMQFSQPVEFLMENKLATRFGEIPGLRFGELEQLMAESDVCIAVGGDGDDHPWRKDCRLSRPAGIGNQPGASGFSGDAGK